MQRYDRPRRVLAVALAMLAGFIDAAGFLAADRYFVSFMSGNTTRLGVDLGAAPLRAWIPAALILGFVCGVVGGALLAHKAGARRKPAVLALVTALILAGAIAHQAGATAAMMAGLVLAMGALNNTFQRNGEVTVGLTYMTGALVRMGQGIAARLTGSRDAAWGDWALLWLGLASGAVLGALAWLNLPGLALWLAAIWAALCTLATTRMMPG